MVDRDESHGDNTPEFQLDPSLVEPILYPFDKLAETDPDAPELFTVYLNSAVVRLAYQLERYDPALSTTIDDYKPEDGTLAFFNGFLLAFRFFAKAGAATTENHQIGQFNAVNDLGFIERRPDLDGDDRDVIEDRAEYIHDTGMKAYANVYPSFRELFEENIELTDPGHPNERNIGLDTYAQAGAGWALLLNYDLLVTAIKDVANAEADALSADVDWDRINFG